MEELAFNESCINESDRQFSIHTKGGMSNKIRPSFQAEDDMFLLVRRCMPTYHLMLFRGRVVQPRQGDIGELEGRGLSGSLELVVSSLVAS